MEAEKSNGETLKEALTILYLEFWQFNQLLSRLSPEYVWLDSIFLIREEFSVSNKFQPSSASGLESI